jgi:hypothetical protein
MESKKHFEKWFKRVYYFQGKPIPYVPLRRDTDEFINMCWIAWRAGERYARSFAHRGDAVSARRKHKSKNLQAEDM